MVVGWRSDGYLVPPSGLVRDYVHRPGRGLAVEFLVGRRLSKRVGIKKGFTRGSTRGPRCPALLGEREDMPTVEILETYIDRTTIGVRPHERIFDSECVYCHTCALVALSYC